MPWSSNHVRILQLLETLCGWRSCSFFRNWEAVYTWPLLALFWFQARHRGPPFALLVTFVTPHALCSTFLGSDRTQFESCFFLPVCEPTGVFFSSPKFGFLICKTGYGIGLSYHRRTEGRRPVKDLCFVPATGPVLKK